MKNKKYLIIPAVALLVFVAANSASAFGGRGEMIGIGKDKESWTKNFEERIAEQASILGISVAEIKSAWAEGKNIHDIAKEKGISDEDLRSKMQSKRQEEMKNYLKTLVDNGSITQAQADARLKFMGTKQANQKMGEGRKGVGKGMGQGCLLDQK